MAEGFKDLLEGIPACGELWQSQNYIDVATGIVITELTAGSLVVRRKYRSLLQV